MFKMKLQSGTPKRKPPPPVSPPQELNSHTDYLEDQLKMELYMLLNWQFLKFPRKDIQIIDDQVLQKKMEVKLIQIK